MKLEEQFFHFFFYPFLIGVSLSAIVIIACSLIFTNNYIDKITGNNIIKLGKEFSEININSANEIISTTLLKIQLNLNELVILYQKLAKSLKANNPKIANRIINDDFLKCVLDLNESYNEDNNQTYNIAYWLLNLETNLTSLKPNSSEKNQLIVYSSMMQNIFINYYSTNFTIQNFYFYFEHTELFISFPLIHDLENGFISEITNYTNNPVWCTDEKGEIYNIYKTKCRGFFNNIKKAKSNVFDINFKDNEKRSIFITDFYVQVGTVLEFVFTLCLEFVDPFTNKSAYLCSDVNSNEINYNLENINSKLTGYFLVNSVGFSHLFFFPDASNEALTVTESIYHRDKIFFLEEKTYFANNIQRLMSSNYIKYINESNDSKYKEIFVNGENRNDQVFYINGEKFEFSIYPIILENYDRVKEHVLNIIFVYNDNIFYDEIKTKTNLGIKILLELIIIIVFGSGLLYLIVLSFNILAKYIVIPIKNVNYMLKGINIGGKNRLEYLNFLKKRQDDNIEMFEKMNFEEYGKKNKNNEETDNNLKDESNENNGEKDENKTKKNELIEDSKLIDNNENVEQGDSNDLNDTENNNELINSNINYYKKFKEENDFIEKETTFYNFNEQLLEFRPLEINRLVKVLIDLKGALIITSTEQQVEQIINYSNSEEIFRSFKNKEGTSICQSNIGNLQSQLLKFDKAIFHLASSLQDNKLKRFLNRALNDEFDDNDNLLNKISISFHKDKVKVDKNLLFEKQQNNTKTNFSQKIIGILINSRYSKLIHVYFRFFSLIQKIKIKALGGLFMNTTFHNINYYHKILIQYIYLCFVKNDLVKIGESILDYIEFLIKFKFKTSSENKYLLDIRNKDLPNLKKKQLYKKNIFNKILNWFNLFDEYVYHVRNNTTLGDDKSLTDDFSLLSSDNNESNSGSQSLFLFKVNLQRAEFLKGKFSLSCKNYTDALFFFIRASKKHCIVLDGLIKKKALKRISKILSKLSKKYNEYGIISWIMYEKIQEYEKSKIRYLNKKNTKSVNINNIQEKISIKNKNSFKKELVIISKDLMNDIGECNAKQTKDIIIIIDFNIYNQDEKNKSNYDKIDSFIDQTKTILDHYLSSNDRLGALIYKTQYQIICPLVSKNKIDIESFSKDLIYYKKNILDEKEEEDDSSLNELNGGETLNEKLEIQPGNQFLSDSGSQESFDTGKKETKNEEIIKGLVNSVNYSINYLKIKEAAKNERYIILFTDIFNTYKITDEIIMTNFKNLNKEKEITLLLVGKNKEKDIKYNINNNFDLDEEKQMVKLIYEKFGERSEIIDFENMKKIKNILSSNNVIKDEIIYPNEIYK